MKVTLESTDRIVDLVLANGVEVPARIWEGTTATGIACHAYITRIAVHDQLNAEEFDRDLQETRRPTAAVEAIPRRLIL